MSEEGWIDINLQPVSQSIDHIAQYGMVKPVSTQLEKEWRFTRVGDHLTITRAEQSLNFLAFLSAFFTLELGIAWGRQERAKASHEMHELVKWSCLLDDYVSKLKYPSTCKRSVSVLGHGALQSWYRIAYHLFLIKNNAKLQTLMLERLRNPKLFQGARAELMLTAGMIAAGYTIELQDESDPTNPHPEFIAISKTGVRIAVEAKSRHREGIMGFTRGGRLAGQAQSETVGIDSLLENALAKDPGMPYFIFIDLNLPVLELAKGSKFYNEIAHSLTRVRARYPESEFPANGIFFHNDAAPHRLNETINRGTTTMFKYPFQLAKFPLDSRSHVKFAMTGFIKMNNVPNDFPGETS